MAKEAKVDRVRPDQHAHFRREGSFSAGMRGLLNQFDDLSIAPFGLVKLAIERDGMGDCQRCDTGAFSQSQSTDREYHRGKRDRSVDEVPLQHPAHIIRLN